MKKKDYDGPLYAPWHLVEKGKEKYQELLKKMNKGGKKDE